MSKTLAYNDLILQELAQAVNREMMFPDALITITYVDCSPDLKQAKVGFSVLPDNLAGTVGRKLKAMTGQLVAILKQKLKLRKLPYLTWEFDATEREASKIERLIHGLEEN